MTDERVQRALAAVYTRVREDARVGVGMSLVGNLEDLSLGDILQIISLSQKSGVLVLESDQGSGRIIFCSGLVEAACLKGHPNDLRGLLVAAGEIDPAGFDASVSRAADLGISVEESLEGDFGLAPDRVSSLVQAAAESSILEMFTWQSGDFSFDVRTAPDPEDPQLKVSPGINAQYLAMEGMRVRDERANERAVSESRADSSSSSAAATAEELRASDPIFGDDFLETEPDPADHRVAMEPMETPGAAERTAADVVAESVIERAEPPTVEEVMQAFDAVGLDPTDPAGPAYDDAAPESEVAGASSSVSASSAASAQEPVSPPPAAAKAAPLVVIEPDVAALEWVKASLKDEFPQIHVFQRADQGLARIRQYLIRGQHPVVLISSRTEIDPLSGIHGFADFVKRLKAQASRVLVIGMDVEGAPDPAPVANLDASLTRPATRDLREIAGQAEAAAHSLRASLAAVRAPDVASASPVEVPLPSVADSSGDVFLRDTAAKLREASTRGEILPAVMDFAQGLFSRVAILLVRDRTIFAVGGRAIPEIEVQPEGAFAPRAIAELGPGWVFDALESAKPVAGPPRTETDRALLAGFGGVTPGSVYCGPIEKDGSVMALLYADTGTTDTAAPETSGLEQVLQHAARALDRAALERAQRDEADAGS